MESSPLTPKGDKVREKTIGKKKKKAEALGLFAVDPKHNQTKQPETADDIWQKLGLTKRRAGQSEATVPLTEASALQAIENAEVSEAGAPLETLSQSERQYVAREIVLNEQKDEAAPLANQETVEHAPESAAEAVRCFRDKIAVDGLGTEQAFAETLQSLGVETQAAVSGDDEARPTDNSPSSESAAEKFEYPTPFTGSLSETERLEAVSAEEDSTAPIAGSASGGASVPPSGPHFTGSPDYGHFAPPPAAALPTRTEKEYVPYYNSGDVMGAALIGGLIGYLIGRRRGRIKTERKLLPVQKKLEQQVKQLQQDIQGKEFYIRKIAGQQKADRQRIFEMERDKTSSEPVRQTALEANQLHGKKVAPERIGRVLITSKDQAPAKFEKLEKQPEKAARLSPLDTRIETMNRAELLELSDKVTVENTTLRQVYETHLVSEQGLRRLISEYSRGGDVQKALRQELVEHEIDFERDPILRDQSKAPAVAAASETLGDLLQKADTLSATEARDELAVLKARQAHHEAHRQGQQSHRHFLDIAMVLAILVLFALVITLLMRGR
jgi:hypothetical protein